MGRYDDIVDRVMREADILLLIIDARRVEESLNKTLESRIKNLNKKSIYVINKVDLLDEEELKDLTKIKDSIQVSAKEHMGTMRLLRKIMEVGKGQEVTVGVIGYPNVGKSSIINALKGKASASKSPISGHTKGMQKIRISNKIMLLDTPGVFESNEDRDIKNIVIGAVDPDKLKDPEGTASDLIDELDGKIEKFFDVKKQDDALDTLGEIAIKKNIIMKGGKPDTKRMGKEVIRMWQTGKIR